MPLFNWTGNPWVDTGLAVMVAKSGKEKIENFTDKEFETIVFDGVWLAKVNRKLNAFTMVVGINSPLTNTSSNPSLKKKNSGKLNPMDDTGLKQYCKLIKELKESVLKNTGGKFLCESCGERPATEVLSKYKKEIGRDWFPLAGSIGSDAQTLPAASRTARICSLCLLSVQFLPLGAVIVGGKIACFQSTHMELTQLIIGEVFNETVNRLQLIKSSEKLSAIGQGKGTKETLIMLIKIMAELQRNKRMLELPQHSSLNVWLLSNSGQNPDCEVIEIPNEALTFLWEAAKNYRQEIETFLRNEPKRIDFQLLECIKKKSEYSGFYPYKGAKPASKGLFELYQTRVLGNSSSTLKLAEWFAYQIKSRLSAGDKNDKKLLAKLVKENAYGNKDKAVLSRLKGILSQLAEEGLLTLEDYTMLFPREIGVKQISVRKSAFKWIWFYFNHEDINNTKPEGGNNLFTHPLIKKFAKDTFDYYKKEKGVKYIKRRIIEGFKRGDITTSDLQQWFYDLALIKDDYKNEAWDDLCRDENGNNVTHEVRFQFRLEIANLYRLAVAGNKTIEGGIVK
jgi:hypothetical protein